MIELMTSDQWNQTEEIKAQGFVICDPDGWDRTNFQYSFYEEKITKEEFHRRRMMSSVAPLGSGFTCCSVLWRPSAQS
jgi:hypothetical protein